MHQKAALGCLRTCAESALTGAVAHLEPLSADLKNRCVAGYLFSHVLHVLRLSLSSLYIELFCENRELRKELWLGNLRSFDYLLS